MANKRKKPNITGRITNVPAIFIAISIIYVIKAILVITIVSPIISITVITVSVIISAYFISTRYNKLRGGGALFVVSSM